MGTEIIVSPLKVRRRVGEYAARSAPLSFDQSKWGAVVGHLNAALEQLDIDGNSVTALNRRLVQAFLCLPERAPFVPLSSSALTAQQKNGLYHWVGAQLDQQSGKWLPRGSFRAEANWILGVAQFFVKMINTNGRSGQPLSDLIKMYKTEAGIDENLVTSDYWLTAALSLPGAVYTPQKPEFIKAQRAAEVYWCDWCGDVQSAPGVPCNSCAQLGAEPSDLEKKEEDEFMFKL